MISLLLAALLILILTACGKKPAPGGSSANGNNTPTESKTPSGTENTPSGGTNSTENNAAEKAMIPGTLNFINLKDGETPVLKALRLYGNRAGEGDAGDGKGFNYKPASTEGIRCIFELHEWVEIYPDTEQTSGIRLWVFEHREDQTSYEKLTFSDVAKGFITYQSLEKPEGENDSWGSFYLNSDSVPAGYYDFIFTIDGKPVATLLTRFYKAGELENKSDAELEQIMQEEIKAAGK